MSPSKRQGRTQVLQTYYRAQSDKILHEYNHIQYYRKHSHPAK